MGILALHKLCLMDLKKNRNIMEEKFKKQIEGPET